MKIDRLSHRRQIFVTLVFPSNADISMGRISIAVPLGAAILGHAEGDIISLEFLNEKIMIRIEEVLYQPEAAGDYHL